MYVTGSVVRKVHSLVMGDGCGGGGWLWLVADGCGWWLMVVVVVGGCGGGGWLWW